MRSIATVEAMRWIGDKVTVKRRYYVSRLPPDSARIALAVRAHWGIKNGMHRTLDMAFGEDQCLVRVDNAVQNFALLRHIVVSLLRQDSTTTTGLKNRHMLACANDRYLAQLIGRQET